MEKNYFILKRAN